MKDQNLSREDITRIKTKLKENYPQLTETDLQHDEGKEENMFRIIAYKLRKTKKQMHDIVIKLLSIQW